ncbi:MAG: sigma-70 family RNA polymerase sigma factor [Caulobacter sp.]|nr:sigma-70 family RNA polymerase sigma factor [Caulobacter sp.]
MTDHAGLADQIVALLPRLRRFAMTLCRNPQDVDDLVHGAVERALNRLDSWRPGTRLDSWMFRILQNHWIDQVRARRPVDDLSAADHLVGEDGRHVTDSRMAMSVVRKVVATLPEEQRAVVGLVLLDDCSYRQAAEILDIPIGTVMSRLSRAREVLQQALRADGPASAYKEKADQ